LAVSLRYTIIANNFCPLKWALCNKGNLLDTQEIYEIAFTVVGSVGGAGLIILSLSNWLGKVWASRLMQEDIAKHNLNLAELRSKLNTYETEHHIRFQKIYLEQAEVISELYSKLYDVNVVRERMIVQLKVREIKEEAHREYNHVKEWEMISGIHILNPQEETSVNELKRSLVQLNDFYGRKRLYLSTECCELMNRINSLSSFMASNYNSLAIKNLDGTLMVHPDIKGVWEKSVETIPLLQASLEEQFKSIIGVKFNA
jgi:hypothetical protein